MKAIILAGGVGSRLRPLTCTRPKPMVPIMNRPILEHIVEHLKRHGITQIIITLFYQPEVIREYFQDGSQWGVSIEYTIEEEPLGTAGAVKMAAEREGVSKDFLVISGDALMDFHLKKAIQYHRAKDSLSTILLSKVENPLEFGIVTTYEDGRIKAFLEKPDWGDVFTDTVNTGLYLLNEDVLHSIPSNEKYDFAKDLFPKLQREDRPLYGYTAPGYWTDVGTLNQYRQAHYDFFDGKIDLPLPGKRLTESIWIGDDTTIHDTSHLQGPLYIGDNVEIRSGVSLGEYSIIGDNTFIEEGTSIKKSIIMNNSYLGQQSEIRGGVIGRQCTLEQGTSVFEGGVVSDDSSLGNGSTVKPRCLVWPGKIIHGGSLIKENLIWGSQEKRLNFNESGIIGLINSSITPQSMARLGSAYGTLKRKASIYCSSDGEKVSQLMKSAFLSGLLSVGTDAVDLQSIPTPFIRYALKNQEEMEGGVHIRMAPQNPQALEIQLFHGEGANLGSRERRRLEHLYYRSQFPRINTNKLGELTQKNRLLEEYHQGLMESIDISSTKKANLTLVVHSLDEPSSPILLSLLEDLGCEVIIHQDKRMRKIFYKEEDHFRSIEEYFPRLCKLTALNGDLGLVIYNGEEILLIDEKGRALTSQQSMLLMTYLVLKYNKKSRIAVPVTLSQHIENLTRECNATLLKTKSSPRAILETVMENDLDLALTQSRFIFPKFQPGFDAFITTAKLLEYLAQEERPLSSIVSALPEPNLTMTAVHCSWDKKGSLMQELIEELQEKSIDLTDGIKVLENGGWVLIMLDPFAPQINLYVEGIDKAVKDDLKNRYSLLVRELIARLNQEKEVLSYADH